MATACCAAVSNPKELLFVLNMKRVFTRSEKRRKALLKFALYTQLLERVSKYGFEQLKMDKTD
jgi:hypothetical protein